MDDTDFETRFGVTRGTTTTHDDLIVLLTQFLVATVVGYTIRVSFLQNPSVPKTRHTRIPSLPLSLAAAGANVALTCLLVRTFKRADAKNYI